LCKRAFLEVETIMSRIVSGRYGVPLRSRLLMMGAAMLAMAAAYASLALSAAPPLGAMLVLGVAYSVVNVGYWASIPMVLEQHQLSAAAGVVGATMNVLPGRPRHHLARHGLVSEGLLVVLHCYATSSTANAAATEGG